MLSIFRRRGLFFDSSRPNIGISRMHYLLFCGYFYLMVVVYSNFFLSDMSVSLLTNFHIKDRIWVEKTTVHDLRGHSSKHVHAFVPYTVPDKATQRSTFSISFSKPLLRNNKRTAPSGSFSALITGHDSLIPHFATGSESNNESVEDGVSLKELTDYEGDGEYLATSVTEWLNNEWIIQDCHASIGNLVKEKYIEGRLTEKINDLGEIMMYIGTGLETTTDFMEDAFVNEWDIVNYVSDLLMKRMDRELCSCSELIGSNDEDFVKNDEDVSVVEFSDGTTSTDAALNSKEQKPHETVTMETKKSSLKNNIERENFTQEVMTSFPLGVSSPLLTS